MTIDLTQRLRDRVAIVTGGASGIGLATARRFAAEGARVVIADLDETTGAAAAAEVGGVFRQVNVADEDSVNALFDGVAADLGSVDIAFNNAGISPPDDDSILVTGLDAWERVLKVNTTSVFFCCKYAIPHMQRQGKGSIINTASFVALLGAATSQIAYTASKGGVLAMTREIAVEFARKNIRANSLCPGPVETPLLAELLADPARRNRRLVHIPPGRFARAEEMANAALFLASDESSYVNGSTFLVDGGITGAYITPE